MKTKITNYKTKRINALTGGKIGKYSFEHGELPNSFVTKSGAYIGNYGIGWWYIRKKMVVCEEFPMGVGIVLKDYKKGLTEDNIEGYYGYTHRGGSLFKIGDKLFDEKYKPIRSDYSKEEWAKYKKEFDKVIDKEVEEGYFRNKDHALRNLGIEYVIPFVRRGRPIQTLEEAKLAAINMSKYLS